MEIKTLSIQQPWSWAIIHGGKNIENRTWRTKYRGPIFIHTSKKIDLQGYYKLQDNMKSYGLTSLPSLDELKTVCGGLYGMVELVSCRRSISGNIWGDINSIKWVLKNPIELNFVSCPGKLGLFMTNLDNDLKIKLGIL